MISAIHNNGIGGRHVDTGFDNSGTHQNVKPLMIKVGHDAFELALAHLPVCDGDSGLWHQLREVARSLLDGFDIVMQKVDLSTAQNFTQYGFTNGGLVVLSNKSFNRKSSCWWRRNNR